MLARVTREAVSRAIKLFDLKLYCEIPDNFWLCDESNGAPCHWCDGHGPSIVLVFVESDICLDLCLDFDGCDYRHAAKSVGTNHE